MAAIRCGGLLGCAGGLGDGRCELESPPDLRSMDGSPLKGNVPPHGSNGPHVRGSWTARPGSWVPKPPGSRRARRADGTGSAGRRQLQQRLALQERQQPKPAHVRTRGGHQPQQQLACLSSTFPIHGGNSTLNTSSSGQAGLRLSAPMEPDVSHHHHHLRHQEDGTRYSSARVSPNAPNFETPAEATRAVARPNVARKGALFGRLAKAAKTTERFGRPSTRNARPL